MARNLPLLVIGGLLAVLLALATACGGGDDDSADGNSDTTATATLKAGSTGDAGDDDDEDESATPTGASDGDDDGGTGFLGEEVDACTLLTVDEINDITGFDVGEGVDTTVDPFWSCNWSFEDLSYVSVAVYTGTQDDLDSVYSLSDGEPVDGLGVKANWQTTFSPVLKVLTETYYLDLFVFSPDADNEELKASSIDLAEVVIARLP